METRHVRHSLHERVNKMLRNQSLCPGDRRVLNEVDLALHIERDLSTYEDTRITVRIYSIQGEQLLNRKLVVLDEQGKLVEVSEKHESKHYGNTVYRAYNVPIEIESVQVRFMEVPQEDPPVEIEIEVLPVQ